MNELIILGNNIRAERNRLHLSQEQLAQKANMQTHHISNIENGKFDIKFTVFYITNMMRLHISFLSQLLLRKMQSVSFCPNIVSQNNKFIHIKKIAY